MTKKILHENGQWGIKLGTFGSQELVLVKSEVYVRGRNRNFKKGTQIRQNLQKSQFNFSNQFCPDLKFSNKSVLNICQNHL